MRFLENQKDIQTRSDINDLSASLNLFKKDFGVYPPSRFLASPNAGSYNTPAGQETLKAFQQIWPGVTVGTMTGLAGLLGVNGMVQGDQCLVFFLQGHKGQGFSMNSANPFLAPAAQGESRKGPYFQFPPIRLVDKHGTPNLPTFVDGNNKNIPYLYFRTYGRTNGYHLPGNIKLDPLGLGDCPSGGGTGTTVIPYYKPPPAANSPITFYQSDSFQIISAGRDGKFEPNPNNLPMSGGQWSPGTVQGGDDFTNFAGGMLKAE